MSLDSIISKSSSNSSSSSSSGYGKNQGRDRSNQRRNNSKPYNSQRQQRGTRAGGGQSEAVNNPPSNSVGSALVLNNAGIPQLLSLPLSGFNNLNMLPMMNLASLQQQQQQQQQQQSSFALQQKHGGDLDSLVDPSLLSNKILKVSSTSDPRRVGGSISHTSRLGSSPTLFATGAESLNQAIKAIAIARGYLEENKIELSVISTFRDEDRCAVSMQIYKSPLRRTKNSNNNNNSNESDNKEEEIHELRVAQNSEPSMTAGSIAKKIRAGERLSIVSIGAGSVCATVRAITIARRYLENDNLDVSFRPGFIHLDMQEGQRSAIKFIILAQQV